MIFSSLGSLPSSKHLHPHPLFGHVLLFINPTLSVNPSGIPTHKHEKLDQRDYCNNGWLQHISVE